MALSSKHLPLSSWEAVLPDALHSIRSLLCTATNATPHERLFSYNRKSASGTSVPSWLTPGPIYIRNYTRSSKHEPIVEEADLMEVNPQYAHVKLKSGYETTVSLRDIAPCPRKSTTDLVVDIPIGGNVDTHSAGEIQSENELDNQESEFLTIPNQKAPVVVRRSNRVRKERDRFADSEHSNI